MKGQTIEESRLIYRRSLHPTVIAAGLLGLALSVQARAACQSGCGVGNNNTFLGESALINNTSGIDNTASGAIALEFNTEGSYNTANGAFALLNNTTGSLNTAIGEAALELNGTGAYNT